MEQDATPAQQQEAAPAQQRNAAPAQQERRTKVPVRLGLAVICAGGFMDAYSYLTRGHVFATGQTGNVVLLTVRGAAGDWLGALGCVASILSCAGGIFFSMHLLHGVHGGNRYRTQRWVAALEVVVFAGLALVPAGVPDLPVNCVISFCAALAFENFRSFGTKSTYSSVFCTGNLRSFAETLYRGLVGGDRHELYRSMRYAALIGSFTVGALAGVLLVGLVGRYACLAVCALFVVTSVHLEHLDEDPERGGVIRLG